eukprot:c1642_g1_i1.p1 GENE.c1642_g1_i1~~c1642_g1_i1.p1  ORF type:complete len:460 (+),score=110.65 c1642_g1_i1:32-1381(+)
MSTQEDQAQGAEPTSEAANQEEEEIEVPIPLVTGIHPADAEAVVQVSEPTPSYISDGSLFDDLDLPDHLLKGVFHMKWHRPSVIQAQALPQILRGRNVIGQAQTGSGKTACFVLGMLHKVNTSRPVVQGVCFSPTRELTIQSESVARELGTYTDGLTTIVIVKEFAPTQVTAHLVFATPGSLTTLVKRRLIDLSKLRVFVVDEADHMVGMQGLGEQTIRFATQLSPDVQRLLFAATFDNPAVLKLAEGLVPDAFFVRVRREELTLDGIAQFKLYCEDWAHKRDVIDDLFAALTIGQTLIFVETKRSAEDLKNHLLEQGHMVDTLHGDVEPRRRDEIMTEFRNGRLKVLIATNVLARGIDILQITLVINFDLPMAHDGTHRLPEPDYESYLHRSGRTARFGRKGITLNLVHDQQSMGVLDKIQKHWGINMQEIPDVDKVGEFLTLALKKL